MTKINLKDDQICSNFEPLSIDVIDLLKHGQGPSSIGILDFSDCIGSFFKLHHKFFPTFYYITSFHSLDISTAIFLSTFITLFMPIPSTDIFSIRKIYRYLPHSMSCALLTKLVTTSISCSGSGVVANGCLSIIFIHSSKVSSCKQIWP